MDNEYNNNNVNETNDEDRLLYYYERSFANIEMIQAAYPDEVSVSEHTQSILDRYNNSNEVDGCHETTTTTTRDNNNNNPQRISESDFPLSFTLHLSDNNNNNNNDGCGGINTTTSGSVPTITMALPWGYPTMGGVQVIDYRSSKPEHKIRLDRVVRAVRLVSFECQQDQTEGAISCCATALETWNGNNDDNDSNQHNFGKNVGIDDDGYNENGRSSLETPTFNGTQKNGAVHTELSVDYSSYQEKNNSNSYGGLPRQPSHGNNINDKYYEWITGPPLVDKKSTFQAHACRVYTEDDVHMALNQLLCSSSKIQRATHNMYAWRIVDDDYNNTVQNNHKRGVTGGPDTSSVVVIVRHDNNDDGEDGAGSKLAYLLDIRKETNILIVVSRWFGGIHLGPKRFAHIVNVARELLSQVSDTTTTTTTTKDKG